jgi:hypothetical protein
MNDGIYTSLAGQITVKVSTFEVRSRGTSATSRRRGSTSCSARRPGAAGAGTPPPARRALLGRLDAGPAKPALVLIGAQPLNDFTSAKPEEEK